MSKIKEAKLNNEDYQVTEQVEDLDYQYEQYLEETEKTWKT